MKKFLAWILMLMMSISLYACGGGEQGNEETKDRPADDGAKAEELNAGVFWVNFSDVSLTAVRAALHEELDAEQVDYQDYNAGNSQEIQIDQVGTALRQGTNLLLVNIVETASPDAAQQICDSAKRRGVPVIFFQREVEDSVINSYEKAALIGTSVDAAGQRQGEMIGSFLLEYYEEVDLNGDGTISYVLFKGQEGNKEAEARTKYAVESANAKLTAAGRPEMQFYDASNPSRSLTDPHGTWSAQRAADGMRDILSRYNEEHGNRVELVIANSDSMAEGAVMALQQAGCNTGKKGSLTIPVYGVGGVPTALRKIEKGQMTGTVKQDGSQMASTIMTLVENVDQGEELMEHTDAYDVADGVAKVLVPYSAVSGT